MSPYFKGTSVAEGFKNSKSKICSGTSAAEGFKNFKSKICSGTSAAEGFKNSKSKIYSGTIRQLAEEGFELYFKKQITRIRTGKAQAFFLSLRKNIVFHQDKNVIKHEKISFFIYHSGKFHHLSTAIEIYERLFFNRKYSGI